MEIAITNGYLPPSDNEIRAAASEVGLNINVPSFVRDVCALRSGGRLKNFEELEETIEQELKLRPIKTESVKLSDGKNSGRNHFARNDLVRKVYEKMSEAKAAFFEDHRTFAQQVSQALDYIPSTGEDLGDTPMYQALNLIKLLQHTKGEGATSYGDASENNILKHLLSPGNIKKAKEAVKEAKSMSKSEKDMLKTIASLKNKDKDKNKEDENPANNGKAGGRGIADPDTIEEGKGGNNSAVMTAALQLTDSNLREALKVSRKLQSFSKLKTSKITKFIPDTQESEVQNRSMKSFSELGKIKQTQFSEMNVAPGLFRYKAVTQQLQLRERGKFAEKQQLLYIVVDSSGSMTEDEGRRISLAAGVLINRLMAVAKGDAKVYWRFFDDKCYECKFVEHKDQAYETISEILKTENFSGGGTNFDMAINTAVAHIETLKETLNLGRPELFMVTDGACRCRTKFKDLKGVKMHTAYVSNDYCEELSDLTRQSGGIVIDLAAD